MFKQLLSQTEKRHYDIISKLAVKESFEIQELANIIKCSSQSIRNDVIDLNQLFDIDLLSIKNNCISMNPSYNNLNAVYLKQILRNSMASTIIYQLFLHKEMSVDSLVDITKSSAATIYRKINKIDTFLQEKYHIFISKYPCAITGPEVHIQHFYYSFFLDYLAIDSNLSQSDDMVKRNHLAKELIAKFPYIFGERTSSQIAIHLLVTQQRYALGFQRQLPIKIINKSVIDEISDLMENYLGINYGRNDLYQILYPLINTYDLLNLEEQSYYEEIKEILEFIENKYGLKSQNFESSIRSIHKACCILRDHKEPEILYSEDDLVHFFSNNFTDFYQDICQVLQSRLNALCKSSESRRDYLFYYIIFQYNHIYSHLQNYYAKIKVLIIYRFTKAYGNNIKRIMEQEMNQQFTFYLSNKREINNNPQLLNNYDLVISQCLIDYDRPNLIYMGAFPREDTYHVLLDYQSKIRSRYANETWILDKELA